MQYISDIHAISERKQGLHQIILKSFIEGQELSVVSALRQFHTIELRKIVSDLRRDGVPIGDRWETTPGKKRYKIYFLEAVKSSLKQTSNYKLPRT